MSRHARAGIVVAAALTLGAPLALAAPAGEGVFEAHNPSTDVSTALERLTPIEWVHLRSVGHGSGTSYLEFSGARSSVRFKAGETAEFVVRQTATAGDVTASSRLYAVDAKADSRQLDLVETGALGPGGWKPYPIYAQALTAHAAAGDVVRLVPNTPLGPGEYCFDGPGAHDGYCFGVDP